MNHLNEKIFQLRQDFMKGVLSEKDITPDPSELFALWLQQAVAAQIEEFQAMGLSTVSVDGKPSSRIVYLREFDNNQFCFYTNYHSRKAEEIENNSHAGILFFWKELERQIRIEGVLEKAPTAQSDAYFDARPYESKVGAWASHQSHILSSRTELEKRMEELKKQHPPETIKRPEFWGGYILKANYYEFWQGRKSRLHDRISFERNETGWNTCRLSP
ncbi:MAG: pyridoxamine 5'-phosphate oxidase [bacterium]|nr:pyridoxamine 5'-phosphate oxidase [bacterium]